MSASYEEHYMKKLHRDLADAMAALARNDFEEAAKAFENRVAYDCRAIWANRRVEARALAMTTAELLEQYERAEV